METNTGKVINRLLHLKTFPEYPTRDKLGKDIVRWGLKLFDQQLYTATRTTQNPISLPANVYYLRQTPIPVLKGECETTISIRTKVDGSDTYIQLKKLPKGLTANFEVSIVDAEGNHATVFQRLKNKIDFTPSDAAPVILKKLSDAILMLDPDFIGDLTPNV